MKSKKDGVEVNDDKLSTPFCIKIRMHDKITV